MAGAEGQPLGEKADQQLEQVVTLRVQSGKFAISDRKVPRHGEHADERHTLRAIVPADLGQDLERESGCGKDPNDLTRLETPDGARQYPGLGQPQAPAPRVQQSRGVVRPSFSRALYLRAAGSPTPGA